MRLVAAVFGMLLGAPAYAAEPEIFVQLTLENCRDVNRAEVERVLAAELGAHLVGDGRTDLTVVAARCDGARLVLEVSDPISRKTLRRSFDLAALPEMGRSRLVAIAASELVLASWAELELNPSPRVAAEGAPPSPAAAAAVRKRVRLRPPVAPLPAELPEPLLVESDGDAPLERRRWFVAQKPPHGMFRVLAIASMRRFLERDGSLWGGGVRVGDEPLAATGWALDTIFETGEIEDKSGRPFDIDTWTLGGQLLLAGRAGPLTGRVGIGLRAGIIASALSFDGSARGTAVAPWGWPFLATAATLRAGAVAIDLAGEGGYVALPLSQNAATTVTLRGVWVSAQVGVGIIP